MGNGRVDAVPGKGNMLRNHDKLNRVDFHWFIVRTLPHQEKKLAGMLLEYQEHAKNILEVYCPTHTTVNVLREGKEEQTPLFAGYVFVLSTQQVLVDFIDRYYPEGIVLYERRKEGGGKSRIWTIPEEQMRFFKDFNENYADQVIVLERPYTDYAFNPKTNEPNEIVKVVDGPLKGREGYLTRFRRERRLVFNMKGVGTGRYFAVSIPDVWSLKVVRLHNAEDNRVSAVTMKERAVDLLAGILQGCGHDGDTLPMLYGVIETLAAKPSLVALCRGLAKQGEERLSRQIAGLGTKDAELLLNLARYEHDNPGYVRESWKHLTLRPFLTPTSGVEMGEGTCEARLAHEGFMEIVRKVEITEAVYYPSLSRETSETNIYYAHIGMMPNGDDGDCLLFANWDAFLGEYFQTAGKANERLVEGRFKTAAEVSGGAQEEKLIASFRNFAPSLYRVLVDENCPVKAVRNFRVGNDTLNVLVMRATDVDAGKDELINICVGICKEINSTTHLSLWRRYLRGVWLHR